MAKQTSLFSFFTKNETKTMPKSKSESKKKSLIINGKEINLLDLVWAKLDGYPWWPALVSEDPKEKIFYRKKYIHVQFFEDPPTRGWVKESLIKHYETPSKCGIPTNKDPLWIQAKESADAVKCIPNEERKDLIAEIISDDEDNSSQESDDFEDSDKSKENVDTNNSSNKRSMNGESSKDGPKTKKRKILILSDSEQSEDEYIPEKVEESDDTASSGVNESDITVSESESESDVQSPVKVVKNKPTNNLNNSKAKRNVTFTPSRSFSSPVASTPKSSPSLKDSTKAKLASFSITKESLGTSVSKEDGDWPHTRLSWLKPENIRDGLKRTPDHPEYDARTIYLPDDFLNKQTPAMRQWWELKSKHFDTILFFKMGKFYELFHMDAILSIQELGLLMMKGENAHTGFPEISYGRYSNILIERGYKVARVEQTETPDMMEKRCKQTHNTTKFDKVVRRELCQVSSLGTRMPSVISGDSCDSRSCYLLAICEKIIDGPGDSHKIGVAFIDTSIGTFYIGQFVDDRHLSRLRTLVSHYSPGQILVERGRLSQKTLQLAKATVSTGLLESLTPEKEFWNDTKTYSTLVDTNYFVKDGKMDWPDTLRSTMENGDSVELKAKEEYELGVSSLGALVWYLKLCKLEEDLISRKKFEIYLPPDVSNLTPSQDINIEFQRKHMILDGATLTNLEVFENSYNGGTEGTLFETLNHCQTHFGKRLLRAWICSPLCNKAAIDSRLNAIEDLRENLDIVNVVKPLMKTLPDLEKLLSKIHSQGLKRSPDHPDNRAILFENQQYSQRKVKDFLSSVNGFKTAISIIESFKDIKNKLKSTLLKNCVSLKDEGGKFPSLEETLTFFDNAFDHALAQKEGKIIPSEGVDDEYDDALKDIKSTKKELDEYLKEQCGHFSAKITYWGNDKKRYQLEVPDHACKKVGDDYELVSQKKGFKRYWTETTKKLLHKMMEAEEHREIALQDIARRIFHQFDEHAQKWTEALECISVLDVLLSLTHYSLQEETVRPTVHTPTSNIGKSFINIRNGRHPCSIKIFSGGDYIPNDVVIGNDRDIEDSHSKLVLLTGPNMGGKSTLMRQTALICLMAQLGSYVPASVCSLTAIDRIFTRLGAWDRIFQGESTFYVELAETVSIIRHATSHSFVIVDELGRGTATYDGTAIAFSVVDALRKIGCRTLFSTHYHSLVDDFKGVHGISLGHMACMVEGENEDDPSQETITFLYKFISGACPKSYGFNAARLADLPEDIIRSASHKAKKLEQINKRKRQFYSLFNDKVQFTKDAIIEIRNLII